MIPCTGLANNWALNSGLFEEITQCPGSSWETAQLSIDAWKRGGIVFSDITTVKSLMPQCLAPYPYSLGRTRLNSMGHKRETNKKEMQVEEAWKEMD